MATTYIENIDNLRPDSWTKNTAADGPTLTNSFLNPTHEKDQILARGIDTINSKLSTYDTKISNVNTRLDTVDTNINQVNSDLAEIDAELDETKAYVDTTVGGVVEGMETLNQNMEVLSGGVTALSDSISALNNKFEYEIEHETSAKLEKVYVNEQLKGDGTQNNPIGIKTDHFPSPSALYGLKKNGQWEEIINGGGGGGGTSDICWYPSISDTGEMSWQRSTSTVEPTPTQVIPAFSIERSNNECNLQYTYDGTTYHDLGNIKGDQGQQGDDGKTPTFSADTTNAHLKWKYTDGSNNWQDLNFAVSGEVGPEGFSPAVSIDDTETGKHKVTITDKTHPSQGQTFTVLDGEDGTDGAKGADACPISAKSTEITNGHNVKIFYTSATNPDTNPLADFNVMDGEDGHGSSDVFDDTTISGNGSQETPYGVDTNVLATHTWVENKHYIANVTVNTTAFSGDGTSQSPLDLKINNPNSNKKYGYQPGTGWTEISEGGTVYDIIGNNGISAKKDTANDRYEVGLSGSYLPTLGGTVSGQLILSAATGTFDNSYIKCINNANVGNAIFGLGSQGGAIIKTVDGNNNSVQVNVNAGSDNSQLINVKTNNGITNVGYLIPAMVEQAGWTPSTDDKILHIVLES